MPGGFAIGGASSRQSAAYVWDLLPYSRRSAVSGVLGVGESLPQSPGTAATVASTSQPTPSRSTATTCNGVRLMPVEEAQLVRQLYTHKVHKDKRPQQYELVAAFNLHCGQVRSYFQYRTRLPFQLTERRRRLLRQYYGKGQQTVALYVNAAEFEHYMPLAAAKQEAKISRKRESAAQEGGGQAT